MRALPIEAGAYAARAAAALFPLVEALRAQLEARDQWDLYRRLERPLLPTLFDMERAGIALDPEILREMSIAAGEEIDSLRRELHLAAGEEINLDSGPQVAGVVQTLGLKGAGHAGRALSTRQRYQAAEASVSARLLGIARSRLLDYFDARRRSTRATAACTRSSSRRARRPDASLRATPTSRTSPCAPSVAGRSGAPSWLRWDACSSARIIRRSSCG
jgi:DNA polymerase-1